MFSPFYQDLIEKAQMSANMHNKLFEQARVPIRVTLIFSGVVVKEYKITRHGKQLEIQFPA